MAHLIKFTLCFMIAGSYAYSDSCNKYCAEFGKKSVERCEQPKEKLSLVRSLFSSKKCIQEEVTYCKKEKCRG